MIACAVSPYMAPPAVAKRLGVAPEKVIGWIRSGKLKAVNVGDGIVRPRYRVSPDALDDFLRSRDASPAPKPARRRRQDPNVIKFY